MIRRVFCAAVLLITISSTSYAAYIKHVHVWWYEGGDYKSMLYISPGTTVTINRDSGTQVDIRIFKTDDAPATVEYGYADQNNGGTEYVDSSASYYTF